ncbi:hypothetical protein BAU18_002732 [Enterococcus diestrammenae]|uniref:Uncharacterized protein n=2 Tax=Enterococcus TaxID=1350 RepID=A0ABV0F826_9ENTE
MGKEGGINMRHLLKFLLYLDFTLLIAFLVIFIYRFTIEKSFDWTTLISIMSCLVRIAFYRYALKKLKTNET